jgi:GT2 family glycosyltransferase
MVQHAGVILGLNCGSMEKGVAGHSHKGYLGSDHGYFGRVDLIQNVSAVTAACMMIRRDVFDEVGGFDERLAIAFNDVDLCLRIRQKGYLIVYTPSARLYHYESFSRGYEDTPEKQKRFNEEVKYVRDRWDSVIDAGDPYYSPNLTLSREDFTIRIVS